MIEPEREAARTVWRHPGLLVGGFGVAVAWSLVQVAVAVPVMLVPVPRGTQIVFVYPLASALAVLVLPAAYAGLFAVARDAREGDGRFGVGGSAPAIARESLRHARALYGTTAVARVVALVPATAAFALLLAGDTALNYWQYTGGGIAYVDGSLELLVFALYAFVAGALGRLVFAFHDLPVLFAGVPPRKGWRAALRFARRRPRSLARYGAWQFVLWLPMVVVLAFEARGVTGEAAPAAAVSALGLFGAGALVLGTLTATFRAAHHVVVYERAVEPVLRDPAPAGDASGAGPSAVAGPPDGAESGASRGRGAVAGVLAVLLVTAAAAGAVGVRVSDARPMPGTDPRPVDASMDADTVVRNAAGLLGATSHRSQFRTYRDNGSGDERRLVVATRQVFDRPDRAVRVWARLRTGSDDWKRARYYGDETATALDVPGMSVEGEGPTEVPLAARLFGRLWGNWSVLAVPGYTYMLDLRGAKFPDADDVDWRVVERTDGRVVVGWTERDGRTPEEGQVVAIERGRLTVDADTGRPTRYVENLTHVEYANGTAVDRYWTVDVATYSDYGATDVERPGAFPDRGAVAWLWDLVYY